MTYPGCRCATIPQCTVCSLTSITVRRSWLSFKRDCFFRLV
nr:MAG TPA: hypothetical protein [Caudoviricetes sp.]